MSFGNVLRKITSSPGFRKAYKNIGAANTKSGGTQFKNLSGGGLFGKVLGGAVKKRLSTMSKKRKGEVLGGAVKKRLSTMNNKRKGVMGPISKIIK